MAVDFPSNPTINDTYTAGTRTWLWDGVAWRIVTASVGPTGPTGPAGYQGSDGAPGPAGADGRFFTGATPPMTPAPEEGDAWFNSDTSRLYVYYDSYWVEASAPVAGPTGPAGANGATGPTGPQGNFLVSDTIPLTAVSGDAWFDSSTSRTYVYMNDAWVEVIGAAGPTGPTGPSGDPTKTIRSVSTNTTLLLGDQNNLLTFTGSTMQTLTVADVLEPGASVKILQLGTGQVKLSADAGVTLSSSNNLFGTAGQNTQVEILCTAIGEYIVIGDTITADPVSGGTMTVDSTYVYHTFTSSGTFRTSQPLTVDYLVIAGGGSGGSNKAGGGGAGGLLFQQNVNLSAAQYAITVGAGGASVPSTNIGNDGSNSSFGPTAIAYGGGGGGHDPANAGGAGRNGGSGGGGSRGQAGGSGVSGQGFAGGTGDANAPYRGAGGGGASQSGANGSSGGSGGNGTNTYSSWATATSTGVNGYYAGGGGGVGYAPQTSAVGSGGAGGGGAGGYTQGVSGTANTGGGGGASDGNPSGSGGSGIVIVRYLKTAVQ